MKDQDLVEVNSEIQKINDRVHQIERIASTVETLADRGVESLEKYLSQKSEREKRESELLLLQHEREIELSDKSHKRTVFLLMYCFFIVALLVSTAIFMDKENLAELILTSSLAIAAGTGITTLLKKTNKS